MFQGSMVAIVTPVRNGDVDRDAYGRLLEFQIQNGTSGIIPCGCTGEPATMTMEEHKDLLRFAVERVRKRVPVIAGTGSNNTREAVDLTRFAEECGADGALLITPYYNKPTQKGLREHYRAVAESVRIPLVLYNVPSRTGVSLAPDTVARLSEIPNIVAVKEASGSLDQVSEILSLVRRKDFVVLSGDDSLTLPMMSVGARGVISVAANIVPDRVTAMVGAALSGDYVRASALHRELYPLFKVLFIETNPIPVKAALSLMGMISPEWRLPLTPPSAENLEKIRAVLTSCGVLS